jgi:hypothetical protein
MKKCFFAWLLVCLVVPKGFSQTVDHSGVYKATLTCWGFKIAEQDLTLKNQRTMLTPVSSRPMS